MSTHLASKTCIRQIVHGRPLQSVICCGKTQSSQEEPPQRRALQDSRENPRKSGAKGERCCEMIGRSGNFALSSGCGSVEFGFGAFYNRKNILLLLLI